MKLAKFFIAFTFLLAFAFQVSAQSIQYPNELKGYEFFENGKLKDLQLTVSSKDDVKKIFGVNCEKQCDYDADWLIHFDYYEDIWVMTSRSENNEKLTYFLGSKYLGKLRSIEIRPKMQLSFADVSFPNTFQNLLISSTSTFRSDKRRMSGDESFQDSNGLTYEILDQTIIYNFKNKKTKSYNKGDLVLIRYSISKAIEKDLFVLQN